MIPEFKFTLSNTTEGSLVIDEPLGWKEAVLKLDRDEKYHSLIEYFESSLTFYGTGLNYIRTVEINQGVDARIDVTIEIKFESTFETLFSGKIDIASAEETSLSGIKYKANYAIIRDDFWAKFINRTTTPVDLRGTTDLYGGSVTAMQKKTLQLPTQKLRKTIDVQSDLSTSSSGLSATVSSGKLHFLSLGFNLNENAEIDDYFTYPASIAETDNPYGQTGASPFGTDRYAIDSKLHSISAVDILDGTVTCQVSYRLTASRTAAGGVHQVGARFGLCKKSNSGVLTFYEMSNSNYVSGRITTDTSGNATYQRTHYISQAITLNIGDELYVYGELIIASSFSAIHGITIDYEGGASNTYLLFEANSSYPDTECEGFLVHDVGKAIVDRIAGEDKFYSEYLGHTSYTDRTYSSAGCGWRYALAKGLHIRGYTLTQKSFFENFESWFDSINAQWNMGLSYEVISSVMSIRVEEKEHFYDSSSNSVDFYNVKLERVYDHDWIFKKIVIGYNKWKAESKGVIDDPQTKTTYSSRFESVGNEISLLSEYIAASLVWEVTRREKIEPGKDWKFDDDIFIMSLNPTEVSSGVFQPEILSPSFLADGILNKATRYNYRLWPMFNFMRWLNVFNGALDKYQTSYYKFVEGEGNYKCSATMSNSSDCIFTGSNYEFTQFEDIPVDILGVLGLTPVRGQYIHSHELYKATIEMSWNEYKLIQASRKKSIGISETDAATSPYFIKSLSWKPFESRAELTVWPKDAKVV